jgi:acetoin utilization deacetylase AcuC-like enzyme
VSRRALWLRHDASFAHDVPGHPERPARVRALEAAMQAKRWLGMLPSAAPPASRQVLHLVHPESHVAAIEDLCARGGGMIDPDTFAVPATWEAACRAAGGAVALVAFLIAYLTS